MGICSSIPVSENIRNEIREIEHAQVTSNITRENLSELKFPQGRSKFG